MRALSDSLPELLDIRHGAPLEARRRHLLNLMLLAMGASATLMLVVLPIVAPTATAQQQHELRLLVTGVAVIILGCGIIYLLNRYVSGPLASALFVLFLIAMTTLSDRPYEVVDGRGLLVFSIPILAASVLLRPWASFVAAGASSVAIILVGVLVVGQPVPNLPAVLAFYGLALVAWVSAHSLERALRKLHATNEPLRESEERYRTLFERLPVGVFRSKHDGRVIDANPAQVDLLGCPDLDTLLATPVTRFFADPHKREAWRDAVEKAGVGHVWEVVAA